MILQLQAKVHGLGNLGVSTCTYPTLSDFKATFWILPPSLNDSFCHILEIYLKKPMIGISETL